MFVFSSKKMSQATEINALKLFLQRFAELENSLSVQKLERDLPRLRIFLSNFDQYERLAYRFQASTAPHFNVFETLRLSGRETGLHTPFLASLLDPGGAHCQGRLFFDDFLVHILGVKGQLNKYHDIQVFEEYHTPYGQIDILIKYKAGRQQQAIVIENKIYAGDQEKQLQRYHNFLSGTLRLPEEHFLLIYLCPFRCPPSIPHSISKEDYQRLKENGVLRELGYREDISPMLERKIPEIKAPVVTQTVRQYIRTLKAF